MRIHSDTLTFGDLTDALRVTKLSVEGVWLYNSSDHGSRKRAHAFEVALRAEPGRDRNGKARRAPNSGSYGADYGRAATYDEWGYWLAELFRRDPNAVMTYYNGADDFHAKTKHAYGD